MIESTNTVQNCYDSIPGWGSEYSSEGVRQVWVGMWLQLIIATPQLYISECPGISEGKVGGSEMGWRWVGGLEVWK